MRFPWAHLLWLALMPRNAGAASDAIPMPPNLSFLYSANITVGLSVDVGQIPAGNVTVIPILGGSILGPNITGSSFITQRTPFP